MFLDDNYDPAEKWANEYDDYDDDDRDEFDQYDKIYINAGKKKNRKKDIQT